MKLNFQFDDGDLARKVENYARDKPDKIKTIVKETAEDINTGAVALVPVDTSNLRNSINVSYFNQGLTAFIGTPVIYAPHVEFGTVKMVAQAFLFPSHEAEIPTYISKIKKLMQEM